MLLFFFFFAPRLNSLNAQIASTVQLVVRLLASFAQNFFFFFARLVKSFFWCGKFFSSSSSASLDWTWKLPTTTWRLRRTYERHDVNSIWRWLSADFDFDCQSAAVEFVMCGDFSLFQTFRTTMTKNWIRNYEGVRSTCRQSRSGNFGLGLWECHLGGSRLHASLYTHNTNEQVWPTRHHFSIMWRWHTWLQLKMKVKRT